jgi:hypothetical protein
VRDDDEAYGDELLMRAVAGEPLPGDDPEAAAVAADIALLRTQVQGLGDALAGPRPRPKPVAAARRRRPLRLALGSLAAACGVAVAGGMAWLVLQGGGASVDSAGSDKAAARDSGGGAKLSEAGIVACARLIVEGTVVEVDAGPGTGQDRITLRVTHAYKPKGATETTVTFPMDHDVSPRLAVGDRPLIMIPRGGTEPDHWALGADRTRLRTQVIKALPRAENTPCTQE